jgi:sugar phosphate isomerase/epimerase
VHLSGVPRGAVATLDGGPRCPPHAGQQDLASIVRGLSATGYAGPLSLEIIPAPPDGIDLVRYGRELLNATLTALTAASVDWRRSGPRTQISGQA